jgi:predicted RNA-binding Zn-ribbon protein involved in translation (DUF1610 family)
MPDDLTLDGNGVGGMLAEALAADPTTLARRCHTCRSVHPMGEHLASRSAGVVLRCPSCGVAAVLMAARPGGMAVRAYGTFLTRSPG